jgi:hypothetical protein
MEVLQTVPTNQKSVARLPTVQFLQQGLTAGKLAKVSTCNSSATVTLLLNYVPCTTSNTLTLTIFVCCSRVSLLALVYGCSSVALIPPFVFFCIPKEAVLRLIISIPAYHDTYRYRCANIPVIFVNTKFSQQNCCSCCSCFLCLSSDGSPSSKSASLAQPLFELPS